MNRSVPKVILFAVLSGALLHAGASVSARIDVTDFRVVLTGFGPDAAPSVSFVGAGGSEAFAAAFAGSPMSVQSVDMWSRAAFGPISATTRPAYAAGGTAFLSGDVFTTGASAGATAHAGSSVPRSTAEGQLGFVNGVDIAYFELAPWTRMTISANVTASAWATGATRTEYADAGMAMQFGDADGGQQGESAFIGAYASAFQRSEVESAVISVSYVNQTDTAVIGTFSGYLGSYASSGGSVREVPEPASWALLLGGGIAAVGSMRRRRP